MQPDTQYPSCPKHETCMVLNPLGLVEVVLPHGVEVFTCPNLSCPIVYATGALEGFYKFEPSGNRECVCAELVCTIPQIKAL